MSGGNDPLVVEDWSAYEKSMLDVLREERRTRLQAVAAERPMTPEELRRLVQDKAAEPEPAELSGRDAAPLPVPLDLPEQKNEQQPCTAEKEEAAGGDAFPESVLVSPVEQQVEPVESCAAPQEVVQVSDLEREPVPVLPPEQPDESALRSAPMEMAQNETPAVAQLDSFSQPAPEAASSWWRIPLLLSALAVAAVGAAVAIVKPDRRPGPAPVALALQDLPVEKHAGAVSPIQEHADEAAKTRYEILGDRVRLRGTPAAAALVLGVLRRGDLVTIAERSNQDEWCRVQAADGREGWLKCDFLKALRVER